MREKITKKIIAGVMLTAFSVMNTLPVVAVYENYNSYVPTIRNEATATSLDVDTDVTINNADSIVNLSLRDADITQVLRMFADQAGMNIIFAPSVKGTITMDLVNIELSKALDMVVNINNLAYDIKDNTLIIGSSNNDLKNFNSAKNMVLIPVKYVSAGTIADFLNKSIFTDKGGARPGISAKPVVTVNPATNELIVMGSKSDAMLAQRIVDKFDRKPTITTFKVNHVTPAEMASLVCETFIPATMSKKGSSGGSSGSSSGKSTGGAAGIPTGFASDSSSSSSSSSSGESLTVGGGELVCSIDQKASADGVEAPAFKNLSVVSFPTLGTIQLIGGSPSQIEMIRDYIAATDIKSPQALLEIQFITLNEEGSKTFQNDWAFYSKNFNVNAASGGLIPYTSPDKSIIFGGGGEKAWTNSPQLVYTVKYLVENHKGRVLSNPKLLVTNGQESTLEITSDYVSKVTTQYLDTGASTAAQVQRNYDIASDNGITLTVTPFISPDGYVVLDLTPEFTEIKEQLNDGSGLIAATLLTRNNMELKGIRIKDGETLVLGGIIRENETKDVTKIPFLGDIPVVGTLFRSTINGKKKEEIVIMVTPKILVDTEDAIGDGIAL